MKKVISILLVAVFASCAAYKPAAPTQADADRAAQKYPGTTLADLSEGKTIFEQHCDKCHSLKRPFKHSAEEVTNVLPKMAHKARLDSRQEELVRKYLLTMNGVAPAN
jgi:cytochrome c5